MATLMSLPLLTTSFYSNKTKPSTTTASITSKRLVYMSLEQQNGSTTGATTPDGNVNGGGGSPMFDRRNVLLGVGGLYGATHLGRLNEAVGAPVQTPLKCHDGYVDGIGAVNCCPPLACDIVDFKFPSSSSPLRVRKAAHMVDEKYLAKYKEALDRMKALREDDPLSFKQQAKIHCAYCQGAYDQEGKSNGDLVQVHANWLFLPFHRLYLYFYERILGKLIGDETFALPFWNFDFPDGMRMPNIFLDKSSPLYDENRNTDHFPPTLLDLTYNFKNEGQNYNTIQHNLCVMRNAFNRDALNWPEAFMGSAVRSGEEIEDPPNSSGTAETIHNAVHKWTGLYSSPNFDMGNFYSAARDPIFFSHHANVDRLWHLYRGFRNNNLEFNDPDWLNASFHFYDENRQLVRVKVRDSLDAKRLRFTYDDVPIPWWNPERSRCDLMRPSHIEDEPLLKEAITAFGSEPRALDSNLRASVIRPKKSRSISEKEEEVEILIIDDIEIKRDGPIRFDVYVAKSSEHYGQYAGSYDKLPHAHAVKANKKPKKTSLKLGITDLLEDIHAEDEDKIVVTLVPQDGDVSVGGVRIELFKTH